MTKRKLDAAALEELEHELIRADLGPEFAGRIAAALGEGRFEKDIAPDDVKAVLAGEIEKVLIPVAKPLEVTARPFVILVAGVNGSGKTTTIGKLAAKFRAEGKTRDAGGRRHVPRRRHRSAQNLGRAHRRQRDGARAGRRCRPAWRSTRSTAAKAQSADIVLVDTAGRLQNRTELMSELEKMVRVMRKVEPAAPHAVLLVLDATVGQNALSQVDIFGKIAGVTGLVMTKLDGTARGGILVAIADTIRPAGAFHRRRRGRRRPRAVHRARFRARRIVAAWNPLSTIRAWPKRIDEHDKKQLNPILKLVLDIGPLVLFFAANAKFGIFAATGCLHGGGADRACRVLRR